MSVPRSYAEAPQEIRDAVEHLIRTYGSDPALLAGAIVSATSMSIMAAKAEANRDLVDALSDMTEHYVSLAGCGDCGFWDPEQESEVIAARKMIAEHRAADVNTAHNKNKLEA